MSRQLRSHLEDVGFLIGEVLLEFGDELVEGLLHHVLFIAALILRKVPVFLLLLDLVDRVASQVG